MITAAPLVNNTITIKKQKQSALNSLCYICVLQNTQRISSSQPTQPLATPIVSVTTPSLPPQGLVYSGMPTTYNPAGESSLALSSNCEKKKPQMWLFVLYAAVSCSLLGDIDIVAEMWVSSHCAWLHLFLQSSPWAVQRSLPYRASALLGSHWAPCRHGNSISWARQLLILWCE